MKQIFPLLCLVFTISCFKQSTSADVVDNDSLIDKDKLKAHLYNIDEQLNTFEENIESINSNSSKIDKINSQIDSLNESKEIGLVKISEISSKIDNLNKTNDSEIINDDSMMRINSKLQILEDRAFYNDSLYFEIINDIIRMENKIISLTNSYKEMIELKTTGALKEMPKLSPEEYREKYIESLSFYQNGEWAKSLQGFNFLISVDNSHDLADNCQYWIAEVNWSTKDYKEAIKEFEKVHKFPGTNKGDDAYLKLGMCYNELARLSKDPNPSNIQKLKRKALENFQSVLRIYPNSEYVNRAQSEIDKLNSDIRF